MKLENVLKVGKVVLLNRGARGRKRREIIGGVEIQVSNRHGLATH
jgi:hypothetical protein